MTEAVLPRSWLRLQSPSSFSYVAVLALIGPIEIATRSVAADRVLLMGHTLAVLTPLFLLATAFAVWVVSSRGIHVSRNLSLLALLITVVWLITYARELVGGQTTNFAVFVLVPSVWLIALKPPTFHQVRLAADLLILGLALAAILGTILDLAGFPLSNQYVGARQIFAVLPAPLEYRWVGVFETTTQASAVGSYLLIYGLWRRGWLFTSCAIIGALILVTGYSRGALAAAAAGLLTILWLKPSIGSVRPTLSIKWLITLGFTLPTAGLVVMRDPTMNGRTPIWQAYLLDLFPQSPLFGLGTNQLDGLVRSDTQLSGSGVMMHAHNILFDSLARFGIIGLAAVVALFAFALLLAFRAGRVGLWVAPALLVTFLVNQLSDVHVDWRYLDYDYSILVLGVVLAASFLSERSQENKPETSEGPAGNGPPLADGVRSHREDG